MTRLILLISLFVSALAQSQVLTKIEGSRACSSASEVFIGQGKNLLFQIHVPVGGNFEIKLNPGTYKISAINADNCMGEKTIAFKKDPLHVSLTLEKSAFDKRQPNFVSEMAGRSSMAYLPYSGMMYPYWYPYSMYLYPQSYMFPCAWGYWGCMGRNYPSGGPIMMGKPNLYIKGPNVKDVKLELDNIEQHKLMATAPAHMEKGWSFDLENGKPKVAGVTYPYLFYDSRVELNKSLNLTKGFCGTRNEVLQQMFHELEAHKFPNDAQSDFREFWTVKFPALHRFCVYPQSTEVLDVVAPLKTSLKDVAYTRIVFFAVPQPSVQRRPQKGFIKDLVERVPAQWDSKKVKDKKTKWHVYEWGLAFSHE